MRVFIRPTYQGRGEGKLLMAEVCQRMTGQGFASVPLWTPEAQRNHRALEGNVRARRCYERLGWGQTHRRKATFEPAGIYDAQYVLTLHRDQWRATCDAR